MRDTLSTVLPILFLVAIAAFLIWRSRAPTTFQNSVTTAQDRQLDLAERHLVLVEESVSASKEIARHLDRIATALEKRS